MSNTMAGARAVAPEQLALDLFAVTGAPSAPSPVASTGDDLAVARARLAAHEAISPPTPTVASLLANDAASVALGLVGDMPSDAWFAAASALFGERAPSRSEVAGLRSGDRALHAAIADRLASASGYAIRRPTRVRDGSSAAPAERIRALLRDEVLAVLEETCLDPEMGDLVEQVDLATVVRAEAMASPAVARALALEAVLTRRSDPKQPLGPIVAAWESLDEIVEASGVDPFRNPAAFGPVMASYARRGLLAAHGDAQRVRALGRMSTLRGKAEAYAAEHPDAAEAVLAAAAAPPTPVGEDGVALAELRAEHAENGRRNRKAIARGITRNLDVALAAGIRMVAEARAMEEACREAEGRLRAHAVGGHYDFGYEERALGPGAVPALHDRRVFMRARWACEVEARCDAGGAEQRGLGLADVAGRSIRFDPATEPVVFEYLGSSWLVGEGDPPAPTGRCPEPTLARYAAAGVFQSPRGLPTELIGLRLETLLDLQLPFPRSGVPGLVAPTGGDLALHRRALAIGMVLVDPASYLHGLLFANAVALTIATSFARSGEVRQIVKSAEGWTVVGVGPFAADAFVVTPKGRTVPARFAIAPIAFDAICDLVEFTLGRDGLAQVPTTVPSADLSRKCGPATYVFAFRGRMLEVGDLNHVLAFLFAGVARARTHDLRHAAAVRARREGATPERIAGWMNVVGGCVPHYSTDPWDEEADAADMSDDEVEDLLGRFEFIGLREDVLAIAGV